jgi:hypothetical protein
MDWFLTSSKHYRSEPPIDEGRAVETFGRRLPAQLAVESVVVVITGIGRPHALRRQRSAVPPAGG